MNIDRRRAILALDIIATLNRAMAHVIDDEHAVAILYSRFSEILVDPHLCRQAASWFGYYTGRSLFSIARLIENEDF